MRRLFSLLVVVLATFAFAQELPPAPKELDALSIFAGKWHGESEGEWGKYTADMSVERGPGGRSWVLRLDSKYEMMPDMEMSEMMYITWNAETKMYDSHAFMSFADTPRIEHGTFRGGKLVMVSEPLNLMGEMIVGRGTAWMEDGKLHFTLEFKDGDNWVEQEHTIFSKVN